MTVTRVTVAMNERDREERMRITSDVFSGTAGFNRAHKQVRAEALEALGKAGERVRFRPECYTLETEFDGVFREHREGLGRSKESVEMWQQVHGGARHRLSLTFEAPKEAAA